MREAPDMRPFYEGVRLAHVHHLHDAAHGRFHDTLVAIDKVRVAGGPRDKEYLYDILPLRLVEIFDTFNATQDMLWQNRPRQEFPHTHNPFREDALLDRVGLVIENQIVNVHAVPVVGLTADIKREARRLNAYAYMFLGRTATVQAVLHYEQGHLPEAQTAGCQADVRYQAADLLLASDGDQWPIQVTNALHAARDSRIRHEEITPQVNRWLGRAAVGLERGGDQEIWLPRSIQKADITGSRQAAMESIYERP